MNTYEKKYKEAVEKIRNLLDEGEKKGYTIVTYKKDFESIFPELVESEGEKIMKWCISHFKACINVIENNDEYKEYLSNKVLTWLEKQGQVKESHISQHENKMCKENGNSLTCEDEKVRKALIDFFSNGAKYGGHTNGVYDKDIIAWLEKQGEKLPAGFYYVNSEGKKFYSDTFKYGGDVILHVEKQGEKKPADSYCQENCKGFQETGKCFADGMCNAKREAEQKPEENNGNIGGISPNWSEDDEINVYNIIHFLEEPSMLENNEPCKKIVINWLQSLKGRVQLKQEWSEDDSLYYDDICEILMNLLHSERTNINKAAVQKDLDWLGHIKESLNDMAKEITKNKETAMSFLKSCGIMNANGELADEYKIEQDERKSAEWSEEDEKMINGLINSLTRISLNTRTDSTSPNYTFYKEIDWLKSLRPQNRWKPSELQLGCLSDAIEHYNSLGYPAPKLKELLDDLKKLKEGKV